MWLQIGNLYTRVTKATDAEVGWVARYLTFDSGGTWAYVHGRRKFTPEQVSLFDVADAMFPTGMLPLLQKDAAAAGFRVDVVDTRPPPAPRPDPAVLEPQLAWLRDYQRAAVDAMISQERGIIWIPTGGGKTEVMWGATKALPARWLMLVNSADLVAQTARRYADHFGRPAGMLCEGTWAPDDRFTVGTFQSFLSRLSTSEGQAFAQAVTGLHVDEVHTLPANSFYAASMALPNTRYRFGYSGTPLARGDKRSIFAVASVGPVLYRVRAKTLIERGVLSAPRIRLVRVDHGEVPGDSWAAVYGAAVVRSRARNEAVIRAAAQLPKPCLVFVTSVAHGRALAKRIPGAVFVHGEHDVEDRTRALAALAAGRLDVLVSSAIFNTGIDIPCLRSAVIAAAGKSTIAALQRLGRGMRVQRDATGAVVKDQFEVVDFDDRGHKWLERHTRERLRAYAVEEYAVVHADGQLSLPVPPVRRAARRSDPRRPAYKR